MIMVPGPEQVLAEGRSLLRLIAVVDAVHRKTACYSSLIQGGIAAGVGGSIHLIMLREALDRARKEQERANEERERAEEERKRADGLSAELEEMRRQARNASGR